MVAARPEDAAEAVFVSKILPLSWLAAAFSVPVASPSLERLPGCGEFLTSATRLAQHGFLVLGATGHGLRLHLRGLQLTLPLRGRMLGIRALDLRLKGRPRRAVRTRRSDLGSRCSGLRLAGRQSGRSILR